MAHGTGYMEREVKLGADFAFVLPDLRRVVGATLRLPEQELRTAYFDTPDLRLWRREITLRHRMGEQPDGGTWTVKLPSDTEGPTLDRTELSWQGSREVIPEEAMRILRGIVRRAPVRQVAELATTRRRLGLQDKGGTPYGELDDDTVTVISGRGDGVRFRQLEVELAPGASANVLEKVIAELCKAGAALDDEPKLAKALDLDATQSPSGAAGVGRGATLADLVCSSIADGLNRLLDHDYRMRLDPSDPPVEDVHQARVATRRLRSNLKTFRPVLDPVWLGHTRAQLKWLGEVFGRVRDTDVLARRLAEANGGSAAGSAGQLELRSDLESQRRIACSELANVLDDDRYLTVLDRLDAAAERPPLYAPGGSHGARSRPQSGDTPAVRALPKLVHSQWRALRRTVRKSRSHPSDRELHRIRIKAKQLRYASELAAPVIGKPARRTAAAAQRLQTILGEHHDAVAAEQWLRGEALHVTPAASFSAGLLSAELHHRQQTLRRRWRAVWRDLERSKRRRWLAG
jgi:CHAD domain-containing protein